MEKLLCNGLDTIVSQALDEMKETQGQDFQLETVNLAELQRRTGISRARLRAWKKNGFAFKSHGLCGHSPSQLLLCGYMPVLNTLLTNGISNSSICFHRLQQEGYTGSLTTIKRYITSHKSLIPAKQQMVMPQRNRGRRFVTEPGEAYQMDWGFTNVATNYGQTLRAACFAMICHHCGQRYIEFFPNAKQENLFIGMIHAFRYMGVPTYILTDNMKSVVTKRDWSGQPIWQKDYEAFMKMIGFQTKLCKPRHPFTKGKVERLIRFVKDNFLIGRTFWNVTDLNRAALDWCNEQNVIYHAIEAVIKKTGVKKVLVIAPGLTSESMQAIIYRLQPLVRTVSFIPDMGSMPLAVLDMESLIDGHVVAFTIRNNLSLGYNRLVKRVFDFICTLVGIILLSPVLMAIGVWIYRDSPGPIIFRHYRVGKNGKIFPCYKFRSMCVDADQKLKELLARDPQARAEWDRDFKLKDDPRITKSGAFLRKTSLDELPQLLNVLKGEMSLVGPRPIIQDEVPRYGKYIRDYYMVRPGVTGMWQTSGRSDVEYDERVQMDTWYVRNWNIWFDVVLIWRTFKVVFSKKGAY